MGARAARCALYLWWISIIIIPVALDKSQALSHGMEKITKPVKIYASEALLYFTKPITMRNFFPARMPSQSHTLRGIEILHFSKHFRSEKGD